MVTGAVVTALTLSTPSLAINHPFIPADECSPAVQGGGPTTDPNPDNPVGVPASANNPGVSTGAQASQNSQGADNCKNAPTP